MLHIKIDNTEVYNLGNFQAGVDTLYNKCVGCGSTPVDRTPTAISNSIQSIYDNRYNEGYNSGYANAPKGYQLGDWSVSSGGTHFSTTYDTGRQVIWAGANVFNTAQAGQPTGGGPTCSISITWSGTVINIGTWGTNQGTTISGKYAYQ